MTKNCGIGRYMYSLLQTITCFANIEAFQMLKRDNNAYNWLTQAASEENVTRVADNEDRRGNIKIMFCFCINLHLKVETL